MSKNPSDLLFEDWELLRKVQADFDLLCLESKKTCNNQNAQARARFFSMILGSIHEWPESWQRVASDIYDDKALDERIRRDCRRFSNDLGAVERVALRVKQELVLVCIRNAGRWYHTLERGESWRGFLNRHIRQLASRAAREERSQQLPAGEEAVDITPRPEEAAILREAQGLLWNVIGELTDEERMLVELRFVESLSLADVARRLDLKYSTAVDKVDRALDKLRKRLVYLGMSLP